MAQEQIDLNRIRKELDILRKRISDIENEDL